MKNFCTFYNNFYVIEILCRLGGAWCFYVNFTLISMKIFIITNTFMYFCPLIAMCSPNSNEM